MRGKVVKDKPETRWRAVLEYDWDGNLIFEGRVPGRKLTPHHDVIRLANGSTMMLALARGQTADLLFELDRDGEVVWEWRARDHLDDHLTPEEEEVQRERLKALGYLE